MPLIHRDCDLQRHDWAYGKLRDSGRLVMERDQGTQ